MTALRYYGVISALWRSGTIRQYRNHRYASNTLTVAGASLMCAGLSMFISKPYNCMAEANLNNRRRKRPPIFGSTVPIITQRGITTDQLGKDVTAGAAEDRSDCPMCKKFGSGPCGDTFKRWLKCTDEHPGKDANGEPLHLTNCLDLAEKLGACLDTHADHYSKDDEEDNKEQDKVETQESNTLKSAWNDFVKEIEDGIKANKFTTSPFPEKYNPSMQFKPSSKTGAAVFVPDIDGKSIITAYIIDDEGNALAAGSKEDMDMGSFGCVLQFELLDGTAKSATCRAIYDNDDANNVTILTRTMLVPRL